LAEEQQEAATEKFEDTTTSEYIPEVTQGVDNFFFLLAKISELEARIDRHGIH
jgi:hypothetical protein